MKAEPRVSLDADGIIFQKLTKNFTPEELQEDLVHQLFSKYRMTE